MNLLNHRIALLASVGVLAKIGIKIKRPTTVFRNCRRFCIGLLLCSSIVKAAPVTLDFELFMDSTSLTTQVSGVSFNNAKVLSAGISLNEIEFPPHSGSNVAVDDGAAMVMNFSVPITAFSGFVTYTTGLTLSWFDATLAKLGSVSSAFNANLPGTGDPGSTPNELLSVNFTSDVARIVLSGDPAGFSFALDDFTFNLKADNPNPGVPVPGTLSLLAIAVVPLLRRCRKIVTNVGMHALVLVGLSLTSAASLEQTTAPVGLPMLSPSALHIGRPTTVLVSTIIKQSNVIPGSVNVVKITSTGEASVIATLNDSGLDGDVIAGDRVYAGRVVLNEFSEGSLSVRVSAAVRGSLRRIQSSAASLAVVPAGAPIDLAVPDLAQQTVDSVTGEKILANSVNACFTDATPYSVVVGTATLVGGTPSGRYSEIGNCYQFTISPGDGTAIAAAVTLLNGRPEVRYAEPEPIFEGTDSCVGPICADPNYSTVLNLSQTHTLSLGKGVVIGILDTGLDPRLLNPIVPLPNAIMGSDFIRGTAASPRVPLDDNGHGTLIAYIAQSTAPDSTLYISKVLDASKRGADRTIIPGMRDAIVNGGAQILNLSFASRLQSFVMRDLITKVQNAGILIIAGAGNHGSSIREYPAAHVGVVAVGNVDDRDARYTGPQASNFGPWVNIAAPGVNIPGLAIGAGTGTSFSGPFVVGTAALVMSKFPSMQRPDVVSQLYRTALPIPLFAGQNACPLQLCNQGLGAGRLDPEAALGSIRITRSTAVGAAGASIIRTIEVTVISANTNAVLLPTTQRAFLGQSTGCEVATVKNPPCISNVPFDFANLASGKYLLQLSFRDPTASFFGSVQLTAPGATFSGVRLGSGTIKSGDPTRADFSLFGFGTRTAILEISKM